MKDAQDMGRRRKRGTRHALNALGYIVPSDEPAPDREASIYGPRANDLIDAGGGNNQVWRGWERHSVHGSTKAERGMTTIPIRAWLGRLTKAGVVLAVAVGASACSSMSWQEEVKLHDGRVIVAERFYNLGGYPGLESHNRMALDETVTFNLSNSTRIVWSTDFRHTVPEPNSLNHFRFDIVDGVPYLATYPAGCIAYNKWGRPNPPQILFKHEGGQWKRITLADLPPELVGATANVIVGAPDQRILRSFYSVEAVDRFNRDISTPEYKIILREPLPNAGGGCPKMVPYGKGGWLGLDWFSDQPSLDGCLKFCEMKSVSPTNCPCANLFRGK